MSRIYPITSNYPISGDRCPLYFDDGEDPWSKKDQYFKVFDFDYSSGVRTAPVTAALLLCLTLLLL